MKKELGIMVVIGIAGSLVSVVSFIIQMNNYLGWNVHIIYLLFFIIIIIYAVYKLAILTRENEDLKSPDEKVKAHLKKYPFGSASNDSDYVAFIEASKSFINNNKDFFKDDLEDLLKVANNGIQDTYNRDKINKGDFNHANALKAKIESHLIKIWKKH